MSDQQWTTLKAIAPLLALSLSVIAILVSVGTAIFVAHFNAAKAQQLAILNERRRDLLDQIKPFRLSVEQFVVAVGNAMFELTRLEPDTTHYKAVASELRSRAWDVKRGGMAIHLLLESGHDSKYTNSILWASALRLARDMDEIADSSTPDQQRIKSGWQQAGEIFKGITHLREGLDQLVFADAIKPPRYIPDSSKSDANAPRHR